MAKAFRLVINVRVVMSNGLTVKEIIAIRTVATRLLRMETAGAAVMAAAAGEVAARAVAARAAMAMEAVAAEAAVEAVVVAGWGLGCTLALALLRAWRRFSLWMRRSGPFRGSSETPTRRCAYIYIYIYIYIYTHIYI